MSSFPSEAAAEAACPMEMSSDNREGLTHAVGIFYWDKDCEITWLADKLIKDHVNYGCCIPLSQTSEAECLSKAKECACIILYYSHKSEKPVLDMQSYLQRFLTIHGSHNVILVISDHKDTESTEYYKKYGIETVVFTEIQMELIQPLDKQTWTPERLMGYKLNHLRNIMTPVKGFKHVIGILNCDKWLHALLTESFDYNQWDIKDLSQCYNQQEIRNCQISFILICYTSIPDGEDLNNLLGVCQEDKIPVVILIDEQDDSSEERRLQILQIQPKIGQMARELFLFSKKEKKSDYQRYLTALYKVQEKLDANWKTLESFISIRGTRKKPSNPIRENQKSSASGKEMKSAFSPNNESGAETELRNAFTNKKIIIGIFSRSGSDNYTWLTELLESEHLKRRVHDVRRFYISNSNSREFREEVRQCTFGILYHTKRRGRVNVTDVTDSLYDRELEYMATHIKKKNVLVVIDDMDDISDKEKERILFHQPSIKTYAQDLILIDEYKKNYETFLAVLVTALLKKQFL